MDGVTMAASWWLVIQFLSLAAVPLGFRLFRWLPDRGYAFSKGFGVLLSSYLFWLMGSLGFVHNSAGGILLATLLVGAFSVWVYRTRAQSDAVGISEWVRDNAKLVLTVELIFALAFGIWTLVRAYNPEITATEKPMDLAFINAIGSSGQFPPLDPWLSGFAISYYYFGYLMIATIAKLANVSGSVAFNLGLAWQFAGTVVGAFGVVYNLVAAGRVRSGESRRVGRPVGFGLLGGVLIAVMGNLEGLLDVLHTYGVLPERFWLWLDIQDINLASPATPVWPPRQPWWWWRASRVIHDRWLDGSSMGLQPIDEFPFFSFLLGDMHPHVLALPYVFLVIGLALNWWLKPWGQQAGSDSGMWGWARDMVRQADPVFVAVHVVCLGALGFLNTWDLPFYLFVTVGALALALLRERRQTADIDREATSASVYGVREVATKVGLAAIGLSIGCLIAYLPFYVGLRSQAGGVLPNIINPTRLPQFFVMFGPFLFILVIWIGALLRQDRVSPKVVALVVGGSLALLVLAALAFGGLALVLPSAAEYRGVVLQMAEDLGGVGATVRKVLWLRLVNSWTALFLLGVIGCVAAWWHARYAVGRASSEPGGDETVLAPHGAEAPARANVEVTPFVLLLVLTAALLTVAPEYVYLKDNFGARMNTIFKFYYQAWVLFGLASAYALSSLVRMSPMIRWVSGLGAGLLIAARPGLPGAGDPYAYQRVRRDRRVGRDGIHGGTPSGRLCRHKMATGERRLRSDLSQRSHTGCPGGSWRTV